MFRYELVNSTRKFTIVAEIVPCRKRHIKETPLLELCLRYLVFALSSRNETHTAKFKPAAILALACFYRNGAIHSHASARGLSMRTHLTAVDVKTTDHNIKWDHFDILASGKTGYHCKVKTLFIQELQPALNANVSSEKLLLY